MYVCASHACMRAPWSLLLVLELFACINVNFACIKVKSFTFADLFDVQRRILHQSTKENISPQKKT